LVVFVGLDELYADKYNKQNDCNALYPVGFANTCLGFSLHTLFIDVANKNQCVKVLLLPTQFGIPAYVTRTANGNSYKKTSTCFRQALAGWKP
jgi:hypothetical protein